MLRTAAAHYGSRAATATRLMERRLGGELQWRHESLGLVHVHRWICDFSWHTHTFVFFISKSYKQSIRFAYVISLDTPIPLLSLPVKIQLLLSLVCFHSLLYEIKTWMREEEEEAANKIIQIIRLTKPYQKVVFVWKNISSNIEINWNV